jgi:prepilin-type N-terminal cleavage/methylation domain-containing protein/prepilin-type processing-associated H-X9-DG protein
MSRRRAFTLIELLVVIAIIAILMAVLMPALSRAREQGKRAACLNNVKQMALTWNLYADDYTERLVMGCTSKDAENQTRWKGWPFKCWVYRIDSTDLEAKLQGVRDGGLYPYLKSLKSYKCPTGVRGEVATYAIPDGMNGHDLFTSGAGEIAATAEPPLRVTLRTQIKRPAERVVMLDEGRLSPSSWTVWYSKPAWWDQPSQRHGKGTNAAFADTHATYWKWSDIRTIDAATKYDYNTWQQSTRTSPTATQPGNKDLQMVQTACWGSLGYTPTVE